MLSPAEYCLAVAVAESAQPLKTLPDLVGVVFGTVVLQLVPPAAVVQVTVVVAPDGNVPPLALRVRVKVWVDPPVSLSVNTFT